MQCACKGVSPGLREEVIYCSEEAEYKNVGDDVLVALRLAQLKNIHVFCSQGCRQLHRSHQKHLDAVVSLSSAIEGKHHHEDGLLNFTFDAEMQDEGADEAEDLRLEVQLY